jgi:hypothetical protein
MMHVAFALAALLVSPAVQRALDTYDAGEFASACRQLTEVRVAASTPPEEHGLVLRSLGACRHIQNELPAAEEAFTAWLRIDPAAELDPVVYPPEMIAFFREVKARVPPPPAVASPPVPTPAPATTAASSAPAPARSPALAVLPFGLGQFQNGHDVKGWVFVALDTAALGFAAFNLYRTESLKTSGGFLSGGRYATDTDRQAAEQGQSFYLAGFAVFGALWLYGAVDGLTHLHDPPPPTPGAMLVPAPGGFALVGVWP